MVERVDSRPHLKASMREWYFAYSAGLHLGTISLAVLKRARPVELPTVLPRMFSGRAATVQRHRQIEGFPGVREARVTAVGDASFPLEVDGDYLGERDEVVYGVRPGGAANRGLSASPSPPHRGFSPSA